MFRNAHITFGQDAIEVLSSSSEAEMKQAVAACNGGALVLGEDCEYPVEFFVVVIHLSRPPATRVGIGLMSEGQGLVPNLLSIPDSDMLLFGLNQEVVGVSLRPVGVIFHVPLDYLFRQFVRLTNPDRILVLSEVGAVLITTSGEVLWPFSGDVVTEWSIQGDSLQLGQMDSSPVSIRLSDGSAIKAS